MSADRKMSRGAPAPPLEDDNILSMILCGLPPLPSSLPRASLVCKRWRRLVTHPHFRRSFLGHHKKAPLLGFFCDHFFTRTDFRPALAPPNRMPAARFSISCLLSKGNSILGCYQGRLLVLNSCNKQQQYLMVWDPITGDRHHVDISQIFLGNKVCMAKGAAVCASREKDHVHGACHSEPFQVVLVGCSREGFFACVYSSETCTWGNLISLLQPRLPDMTLDLTLPADSQGSLVGNSVYWVPVAMRGVVLEFNLHRQTLSTIDAPPDAYFSDHNHQSFILPADGGGISFIVLSGLSVYVWKRISNGHGGAGWLFEDTIDLSNLGINIQGILRMIGRDEDDNMMFRLRDGTVYLVHLKTKQLKELSEKIGNEVKVAHPFSSFYTAGMHPETGMHGGKCVNNA